MTLEEIEAEVRRRAAQIGASDRHLPTFSRSDDTGLPHIEVEGERMHFVSRERGYEYSRDTTLDADELLFWVFKLVTFTLASEYEVTHRVPGQDSRRMLFARQEQLLGQLSPAWAMRLANEHARILQRAPYDDHSDARVDLTMKFTEQGHAPEDAWRMACEQIPLPPP